MAVRGKASTVLGADFSDVAKTTKFTTDVAEYHRVSDEQMMRILQRLGGVELAFLLQKAERVQD